MPGAPSERSSRGSDGPAPSLRVGGFEIPTDRAFDPHHHLWVAARGPTARIGLDALGQERTGPIGFVRLVAVGTRLRVGDAFGSFESQKFVGQLVSPVAGIVRAVNSRVLDEPQLLNVDPFGEGWLVDLEEVAPEPLGSLLHTHESIREYLETGLARCRPSAPSEPQQKDEP